MRTTARRRLVGGAGRSPRRTPAPTASTARDRQRPRRCAAARRRATPGDEYRSGETARRRRRRRRRRRSALSSRPRLHLLVAVVLVFFLSLSPPPAAVVASPPGFLSSLTSLFGRGKQDDGSDSSSSTTPRRSKNLLKVDPSNIIALMTKRGGLVLPKSVRDDLRILEKVCRCRSAYLDVLNREMEVRNFTVSVPIEGGRGGGGGDDDDVALSIGRFYVKWDSYARPCVEVEVDDVEILVEFLNLILTRNNWNELKDAGFPPALIVAPEGATPPPPSKAGTTSTFVRVGSVDLSGHVVLRVRSRPLDRPIVQDLVLGLDALDDLNSRIRSESTKRKDAPGGRRGCTTDELYGIVRSYFGKKIKALLRAAAIDLGKSAVDPDHVESETVREARRVATGVASGARDAFGKYASGARDATEERIKGEVTRRLARWGVGEEVMEAMRREVTKVAEEAAEAGFDELAQAPEGEAEGGADEGQQCD